MVDLLCYSPSLEQHLHDVWEVLSIMRQEELYVKVSKCAFGRAELGFLDHRVSAAGVAVDPRKVAAMRDWSRRSTLSCAASWGCATTTAALLTATLTLPPH